MKALEANGKGTAAQETQSPRPQTKLSTDMSPALIAQANWTFVEALLKVRQLIIEFLFDIKTEYIF